MEGKKSEPGILFPDTELDMVPLDEPHADIANGQKPSVKLDGEPVSRQVIHTPRIRPVPPPKASRPGTGGDKLILVLTVVAAVVAFVALIIGGVGLSRTGDIVVNVSAGIEKSPVSSESGVAPSKSIDEKVWTFAIGDYGGRLEYIDVATGEVKGYNVDIINAVCRIAEKNCQLVWDVYDHCWEIIPGQGPRGGIGLLGGWYDACTGWSVEYARTRTFKFTHDMGKQHFSVFMIAADADLSTFNWRDLTGKTIGFLQSYIENETCLRRYPEITGGNLARGQVRYYVTQQELLTAVSNGEVDAVFVNEHLEVTAHLQVASDKLSKCSVRGEAMMTRKTSTLPDWWNPAFHSLTDSPEYLQICMGLEDENVHGSFPGPTLAQHCIGF